MHYKGNVDESAFQLPASFTNQSEGYSRYALVDRNLGSVHMSVYLSQLDGEGLIGPHIHAYEEVFYIIEGQVLCRIEGRDYRFVSGDFGVIQTGVSHNWLNTEDQPVRWLEMGAPQPKIGGPHKDTFFASSSGQAPISAAPEHIDTSSHLGHYGLDQIPPPGEGRVESGGLKGVLFQMMVDETLGAQHSRLFLIEYQPGVSIGLHDHPFEESYLILQGEVEATADGQLYLLKPGDVFWTGVGCVHAFANISKAPVVWIETQAPLPPAENGFRFMANWEELGREFQDRD